MLDSDSVLKGFKVFRFKNVLDGCTNDNVEADNIMPYISLEPIITAPDPTIEILDFALFYTGLAITE